MEKQKSFLDYMTLLYQHRWLLINSTAVVAVLAVIVSLLLPKWYTAESVILAPKEEFSLFPSSSLSRLSLSRIAMGPGSEALDRYLSILQSRSVTDRVILKFNLIDVYDVEDIEEARKSLQSNVDFAIEEVGSLRVTAWDKSPERVSRMANYYVSALDSTNRVLTTKEAQYKRMTIEKRYNHNKQDLKKAEQNLKEFQEKYNIISLPEQTEVTIAATAELMGQLSLYEMELGVKEKSLGSSHPEIKKVKSRIEEYQKRIRKLMEQDAIDPDNPGSSDEEKIFIPIDRFPEISIEYIRLQRDMKAQHAIFELLTEQLELAKLMEMRDTPTIQILDYAVPPLKKALPKRMTIVIIAALSSLILSIFFIIIKDYIREIRRNMKELTTEQ